MRNDIVIVLISDFSRILYTAFIFYATSVYIRVLRPTVFLLFAKVKNDLFFAT